MIRKRKEIEDQLEDVKKQLVNVIKGALEREEQDNGTIEGVNEELRRLRSETCFEDTLEGKVEYFEETAFHRISTILKELSAVTGKSYIMKPTTLHYTFGHAAAEFNKMCSEKVVS